MAAAKKKTVRKKAAKKASARKSPASKTAKKKGTKKKASGKAGTPAAKTEAAPVVREPSLEEKLMAPLAQFERLLEQLRVRGDWLRQVTPTFARDVTSMLHLPDLFEARAPSIDLVNKEKEIVLRAEVPGIDKEDLSVTVTDRSVTIKGENRSEEESDEGDIHRREIRAGSFSRSVSLPEDVDGKKAKASYKDGVVELRLPKRRAAKAHTIKLD